ncbi:glucose-6-phosphate dehydrogenase [Campylobacter sp. MIT 21-1685]|uniref:glucose-6-phosphate dehydrogenase n=1 Tax=unclassified Campylobacter TaxID=2593542 RepID=UPI00224A4A9C|nr:MULTISPECIES: glucose-6-phosphate dehydrogenase [unclassified Campylobacter]MCX2683804.1 glucose-6-phosphate dehydrogenase [Campylobacter sp. MIT 21-1684]MCX2752090.1 glucose-6-phosphate dehydrogenase [Campylobacter sp. MIT 21-1682]MCX2808283.1 glucose-6-phosphate dehydrogenase [Campylobacter sp. MIT 21-1685]
MRDFSFVLFGATGDLAMRKIFPALYEAYKKDLLHKNARFIATGRTILDDKGFLEELEAKSKIHIQDCDEKKWEEFVAKIHYLSIDLNRMEDFYILKEIVCNENEDLVIYFSISPEFFIKTCENLARIGLNTSRVRIVLEKPLGVDLHSCKEINDKIARYYQEEQIYRIDHYLGKESVQNIMFLRAYNPLFSSVWNKEHIACVEISVFETLGIQARGEFYDRMGALRDMLQNHMLQILCLVAMQLPKTLDAQSLRAAKLKLLQSLKPFDEKALQTQVIKAQYTANKQCKGYLEELNVQAHSQTETFVALKTEILDTNWLGVPFYLRTGKRMANSFAHIVLHFKSKPNIKANKLIISLQPRNELYITIQLKQSGRSMQTQEQALLLNLDEQNSMYPYESLILDAIEANLVSFNHKEELEAAWTWLNPLLQTWHTKKLFYYPSLSWGPQEAFSLIENDGFEWYNSNNFF